MNNGVRLTWEQTTIQNNKTASVESFVNLTSYSVVIRLCARPRVKGEADRLQRNGIRSAHWDITSQNRTKRKRNI